MRAPSPLLRFFVSIAGPLFVGGFLLATLAGCGDAGDEPYAGWKRALPIDESYEVRYLEPPWRLAQVTSTMLRLEVESNASRFAGIDASTAVPPKYAMTLSVVAGTPQTLARSDAAAVLASGGTIIVPPRPLETRSGDEGWEVIVRSNDAMLRYSRFAYVADRSTVVRVAVEASPDLAAAEMDRMIESLDVRPERR